MIGDTFVGANTATPLSYELKGSTGGTGVLTFVKVNQDAYGSEYRYVSSDSLHKLLLRNSVESPRKDGYQFDRHNVEYQYWDLSTPATPVPYIWSSTIRFPNKNGVLAVPAAMATAINGKLVASTGAYILKLLNFES